MKELEDKLAGWFAKFPHIPTGAREFIVKVSPWIAVILFVVLLPVILAAFSISAFVLPFSPVAGYATGFGVGFIFAVAGLILWGLSIPGLFKRTRAGWEFSLYGVLLGTVESLVRANIIGAIINALIGLYILFEVREYYK